MLQSLKSLLIVILISGFASKTFRFSLNIDGKAALAARLFSFTTIGYIAFFASFNNWLTLLASFMLLPLFARTRNEVGSLFLVGMILFPAPSAIIAPAGILIGTITPHSMLAVSGAIKIATLPRQSVANRRSNGPFALLLFAAFLWLARDFGVTSILRTTFALFITAVLPYYILSASISSRGDLRRVFLHLAYGGVILSLLLMFESVRYWPLFSDTFMRLSDGNPFLQAKMRGGLLRAFGPAMEATLAALVVLTATIASFGLRSFYKSKLHYLIVLAILIGGLLMPQSRNAILGLAIAATVYVLYRGNFGQVFLPAVGGGAALLGVSLVSGKSLLPAFNAAEVSGPDYREQLFTRGLEEFWKNPVFGLPIKSVEANLFDIQQGEKIVDFVNGWLYIALITGVIGLSIFLGSVLWSVVKVAGARGAFRLDRGLMASVLSGLLSYIVMFAFTSATTPTIMIWIIWTAFASQASLRADRIDKASGEPTPQLPLRPLIYTNPALSPALPQLPTIQ